MLKSEKLKRILAVFCAICLISSLFVNATVAFTAGESNRDGTSWSVGLVFYDSTVDGGLTPLTEVNWDASDGGYELGETRVITMQITYRNSDVSRDYAPGELQIDVPNLVYNTYGTASNKPNWNIDKIVVGANDSTHSGYDWNFITGSTPTYSQKVFRFNNAEQLEAGSNFEGSIQIVFQLTPSAEYPEKYDDECTHKYNYSGQATLKTTNGQESAVSNEVTFDYTRTYNHPWRYFDHNLRKSAQKVTDPGALSDDGDDYIWVKYIFTYDWSSLQVYPNIFADGIYVSDTFPEDCVVLDQDCLPITPEDDGSYKITKVYESGGYVSNPYVYYKDAKRICYVGYPKDKYNEQLDNMEIHNEADLWGRYYNRQETELLSEAELDINLNDFLFVYPPGYYRVDKDEHGSDMRYQDILSGQGNYYKSTWGIRPTARYSGHRMDLEFGDDVLYYLNSNNKYTRLLDDDYYFTDIRLSTSGWKNENDTPIVDGKYNVEFWVRYAGNSEYTKYDAFKNGEKGLWSFSETDHVVGFYFVVRDMRESLRIYSNNFVECVTAFRAQDIAQTGSLYNFGYIKAYLDDGTGNKVYANQPTSSSYVGAVSQQVAAFDRETYGEYRQRGRAYNSWTYYDPRVRYQSAVSKLTTSLIQNDSKEEFTGTFTLNPRVLGISTGELVYDQRYAGSYHPEDMLKYIGAYDLLPLGVELTATADEILSSISFSLTHDSVTFYDSQFRAIDRDTALQILKDHASVTVTPDWRGTGRTHIALRIDISDSPFYMFAGTNVRGISCRIYVPYRISYDSYLEYGTTYQNYDWSDARYMDDSSVAVTNSGSAIDEEDINENGDTSEKMNRATAVVTITSVVSTHQSLEKSVLTPSSGGYVPGQANADIGGEYSYRLRVRTGRADVTNVIVYDSVERYIRTDDGFAASSGGANSWLGALVGVDTSHPESKGYAVRVWWTASEQPGKIGEDNTWQIYTDTTDNTAVRSLAFEYLDSTGAPAVIPAGSVSYLYIKMKAPQIGYETKLAYNGAYSDWTALDSFGAPVHFITGISSNIVRVSLLDTTTLNLTKTWLDDDETQRPQSILVQLLRGGAEYGEPVEVKAENEWKYTFTELPKYDDDGNLFEYSVKELDTQGYYGYFTKENGEAVLINVPLTSAVAKKIWVDDSNHSGTRPEKVVFQLMMTVGGVTSEVEGKTVTLSGEGNEWTGSIPGLPALTADGEQIVYSFKEKQVPSGYVVTESSDGLVITNTITGKVSVSVKKLWIGPAAESITIELLASGVKVAEAVLNAANDWRYTFADLDKYSAGVEIEYTVRELTLAGYSVNIAGNVIDGFIVTNTNIEKIDIPVEKRWIGPAAERVIINLLADGEAVDEIELSAENNWQHIFTDLIKYDPTDGHEIVYTIEELDLAGYDSAITGNVNDGFVITNTNTQTVDISVIKQWVGSAAESITINLLADGEVVTGVELSAGSNWRHTFTNLPKYDSADGHEIVYTISEDAISEYETSITGDVNSGFVVTNTETTVPATPGSPKTGDNSHTPLYIYTLLLYGFGLILILFNRKRKSRRPKTF